MGAGSSQAGRHPQEQQRAWQNSEAFGCATVQIIRSTKQSDSCSYLRETCTHQCPEGRAAVGGEEGAGGGVESKDHSKLLEND